MKNFICLLVLLLLSSSNIFAADLKTRINQFRLLSKCQPMYLLVEVQRHDTKINLTDNSVQNLVESRLRSARLFTEDILSDSYLHVHATIIDNAFHVSVEFNKEVVDTFTGHEFSAPTWGTSSIGIASNANYVLSSISKHVDKFLTKYLRVNEKACKN